MAMRTNLLAASAAIVLAACGGGGGDVPSTVSEMVPEGAVTFSKGATFTVTGSQLDSNGLSFVAQGCTDLVKLPGGTSGQVQVRCTVTSTSQVQLEAKTATGEVLLSRTFVVSPISDITTEGALAFSKTAAFTIQDPQLDKVDLSVSTSGCRGLAALPGNTPTQVQVSCTVVGASEVQVDAKDGSGKVLFSRTFPVPVPEVTLQTSLGTVKMELSPDKAPNTVFNFLRYVNSGFYPGTLFHRVMPDFVVQGGGFTTGPTYKTPTANPIPLEVPNGLSNLRGTVAMARTSDPNSATSQFYVNLKDNPGLDYASASQPGYAVFGKVTAGLAVIDTMATQPTTSRGGLNNVPQTDIVITSAVQTR